MFDNAPTAPEGAETPITWHQDISVRLPVIKALLKIIPTDDPRLALRGLCLDEGPQGAMLVATDGNVLVACKLTSSPRSPKQTIYPATALKTLPSKGVAFLVPDERRIDVVAGNSIDRHAVEPIEAAYPDWRALTPTVFDPEYRHHAFDPALQAKAEACIEAIAGSREYTIVCDAASTPGKFGIGPVRCLTTRFGDVYGIVVGRQETDRTEFRCPSWASR